jgi:hypothetical protein
VLSADQPFLNATCHHRFKDVPRQIAVPETSTPVL